MSFGSLSANAILALNEGALRGGFHHDTGEGSISRYHREPGGDLVWEIGSGYFGCRNPDGTFNEEKYAENARSPQVKMIELKISQGAKPGHGGVLPGPKVTPEIAEARGVAPGVDCISPASHSAFSTPVEMMRFIAEMRRLSGGKPAGFKLCIGHEWEFLAVCKAMLESGIYPDFIVVDGKEGGTGAAPMEFVDHIGKPMRQGLYFVHNALIGIGGLAKMHALNQQKARLLYDAIDGSGGFYRGHAQESVRSLMNVTFRLPSEQLEKEFVKLGEERSLAGLKGHRSVGGIRASIYNAMPMSGVEALRGFIREFRQKNAK